MATMELRRVPYGTTFTVFGDEFVALDYINGGVLAIRRDIWKDAPFDREGVNDLRKATINGTLADYEDMICEAGAAGNRSVPGVGSPPLPVRRSEPPDEQRQPQERSYRLPRTAAATIAIT